SRRAVRSCKLRRPNNGHRTRHPGRHGQELGPLLSHRAVHRRARLYVLAGQPEALRARQGQRARQGGPPMAVGERERDPVTGQYTTGHDWNGIKELDNHVPRPILFFLIATALFSIVYWVLMPAWPIGVTYTKGLLGIDQRQAVEKAVEEAAAARRAAWAEDIAKLDFAEIRERTELMQIVSESGSTLFGDNCAVCHGLDGSGNPGFPSL